MTEDRADQWKEHFEVILYSIQDAVLEISGVLESIAVAEFIITVRNIGFQRNSEVLPRPWNSVQVLYSCTALRGAIGVYLVVNGM